MSNELLRHLPSIDRWLTTAIAERLCTQYSTERVKAALRMELTDLRRRLTSGDTALPDFAGAEFEAAVDARLSAMARADLQPVINATGVILHTNLGRAPLADSARQSIDDVAGTYSNLEFNLNTGKRGSRNAYAADLLCEITGAEDALVVNNCAAALVLVLARLCKGHNVVISRGELIEIGGSFRMPDVIAESGAIMSEVGTTNRTSLEDYDRAIDAQTRILLASHPSNYRVIGFSAQPSLAELAALAKKRQCLSVLDLGSGCLVDLSRAGFAHEPTVQQCLRAGIDLVTFSGDKLLGGPQAGVIVGRRELVTQLRGSPLARAMRIDKLSLTGLVATLQHYLPPDDPFESIPVLRMLTQRSETSLARTQQFAARLGTLNNVTVSVVESAGFSGGGTLPAQEIQSAAIALQPQHGSADELAERLRLSTPPIIGRIRDDALLLDLRTVQEDEEAKLISRLQSLFE